MIKTNKSALALLVLSAIQANAAAEQQPEVDTAIEEITVVGKSVSYANNFTNEAMQKQQSNITSVLAVVDNLPGVLINEGDTFGADDWSTSIAIRGFQVNLNDQQIGMTVDGIANGNSNYGGGAKANRYIDNENLGIVEVSQGTADISSRSNEALGGTLNFTTVAPTTEEELRVSATFGDFDAQRYFVRYNTGEIAPNTYAWISASTQQSSDWMDQAAQNTRDHFAVKLITEVDEIAFTSYLSYDDAHEDNYQRVYGTAQFEQNPEWDQLTSEWTGIPYIDQAYRRGWSTLRENLFGYVKAEASMGEVDFSGNVYFHTNSGRGDWIPPYIVEVTNDGEGNPNSELSGPTVMGGPFLGQIFFVDPTGATLSPAEGCVSSLTFPYGGGGAQYDPACYSDSAIPVGSYRHTHYQKERYGANMDFVWATQLGEFDNTLRGGLWFEDYNRYEHRDWHARIDSRTSFYYQSPAYWRQYDRTFPVETLMYYLEDELDAEFATFRLGVKQFNVDVAKQDNFDASNNKDLTSDSDLLFSAGVVVPVNDRIELFAGYAENFAAIKEGVLERDDADARFVEPETADNIDAGIRYNSGSISASLTYYTIEFDNRITFISIEGVDGIDYLEEAAGAYVNVGGIESKGFEASFDAQLNNNLNLFVSLTSNESEYNDAAIAGNKVVGTPEEMAVVSLDWTRNNYFAGLSTKYVGERYMDTANTDLVDAYTVADFYIGTSVDFSADVKNVDIRFTINNLTDESYLGTVVNGGAWIGAPRTAALNASMTF